MEMLIKKKDLEIKLTIPLDDIIRQLIYGVMTSAAADQPQSAVRPVTYPTQ